MTPRKRDALYCIAWFILIIANTAALLLYRENEYGFLMLFSLIMFLNDNKEYKQKYWRDKENNQ